VFWLPCDLVRVSWSTAQSRESILAPLLFLDGLPKELNSSPSHFVAKNLSHIKMPCAVCWQQSLQEHLLSFLDRESRKVSTMANLMIGSEYDAAGDPYIYVVWVW